ncbi:MAG: metal ABC transporter permease [Deltaproteobacteria bacterium]|nr:metal ABC transporter permease [Deltaproteobacteria bacterium]
MLEALEYPFFRRALVAGLLASIACGVVGTYVVVKRISSISGSLSHAAFGGVGLGYLLGFDPIIGAAGFSLISSAGLGIVYRRVRGSLDTLLAMFWSTGMALGMLFIALTPGYAPDLMSYLFGSILFVPESFLWIAALVDLIVVGAVLLLFKEFQAVAFDEEFAEVIGIPVGPILHILLGLIALTVVTLIRIVGVIMVIALLTFPAATARHWCESLTRMMIFAGVLSAISTTFGLFGSYWLSTVSSVQIPTGPLTVLIAAFLFAASSFIRTRSKKRSTNP